MIEFIGKDMEYRGSFTRTSQKTGNSYTVVAFESPTGDRFECMTKTPENFNRCTKGDVADYVFSFNPRFSNFIAIGLAE